MEPFMELSRRWRGRVRDISALDALTKTHSVFATGFALQSKERPFGPEEDAYGHPGMGGSIHCAWPRDKVGFSYAMNSMRNDALVDPRP
jgi:hypothetical protein